MADKLNKSLDEIMTERRPRGGRGGSLRGGGGRGGRPVGTRTGVVRQTGFEGSSRGGGGGGGRVRPSGRLNLGGGNSAGFTPNARNSIPRVGGGGGVRKPRRREDEQTTTTVRTGGSGSFRGGRGASAGQRYSSADADSQWNHDLFEKEVRQQPNTRQPRPFKARGTKLQIKNLHYEIDDKKLMEVFKPSDGDITKVVVHFDRDGRSLGTGDVFFANAADARRAASKYDQARINGLVISTSVEEN